MRIGIDARLAGLQHAGIGRYIEELLRAILPLGEQHEWIIFVAESSQLSWLPISERVQKIVVPVKHYTVAEQLQMPLVFAKANLDILHVPHFNLPLLYTGKVVLTIHDLLWHEQKDHNATTLSPLWHRLKYWAYKIVSGFAMKRAAYIIVPTHAVEAVVRPHTSKPIRVISEGFAQAYAGLTVAGSAKKSALKEKYITYVGSLYPHKNVETILSVLQQELHDLHLVLISGRSVFQEKFKTLIDRAGLTERVHMLGYQTDEKVAEYYQHAVAHVFPSLSEGFGLSGVEAMAAGCPVVCSDIPVFREVYKDAASYVQPEDIKGWAKALTEVQDSSTRKGMIAAGKKVSSLYSWKKAAEETLTIYAKANTS